MRALPRLLLSSLLLLEPAAWAMAAAPTEESPRPAAASLTAAAGPARAVDARGFIRRWMVLEPRPVSGPLTESSVEAALQSAALPFPLTELPREAVHQETGVLRWHALDTRAYNFNLYHFAWALSRPTSNVLFWVITIVESPVEMRDVRLAIGSNAASHWWLNGSSVIAIYGDRQTVIDDGVSQRLTLHKGRNVIRAAIVNGGGATDFCARFLDAADRPITGLSATVQP